MSWAKVQSGIHQNGAPSSNTVAVTLTSAVGSGNLVCVNVGWASSSGDSVTVVDDKSNSYHAVDLTDDTAQGYSWATFYLAGITNSPTTITATFGAGASKAYAAIVVDEFSGGGSGTILDGHVANTQNPAPTTTDGVTSGSITTTTNGDLIYGSTVNIDSTGTTSTGTGFTQAQSDSSTFITEYQTQATAGSTAATYTSSLADHFITAVMAFKPSGGGTTYNQNLSLSCASTIASVKQGDKVIPISSTSSLAHTTVIGKMLSVSSASLLSVVSAAIRPIALAISCASSLSLTAIKVHLVSAVITCASSLSHINSAGKAVAVNAVTALMHNLQVDKLIPLPASTVAAANKNVSKSIGFQCNSYLNALVQARHLFVLAIACTSAVASSTVVTFGRVVLAIARQINLISRRGGVFRHGIHRTARYGVLTNHTTGTTIQRVLTIACASAMTHAAQIGKQIAIASSSVISAIKRAGQQLTISSASAVTAIKQSGKSLSIATVSAVLAAVGKAYLQTVTIACVSTINSIKQVGKGLRIASTSTVSSVRSAGQQLSIACSSSVSSIKSAGQQLMLACASAVTTSAIKAHIVSLLIASTTAVAHTLAVGKGATIACNSTLKAVKQIATSIGMSCQSVIRLVFANANQLTLAIAVSSSVALSSSIVKSVSIAVSSIVNASKAVNRRLVIACSSVIELLTGGHRFVSQTVIIACSSSVSLGKMIGKQVDIATVSALQIIKAMATRLFIVSVSSVSSPKVVTALFALFRNIMGQASSAEITGTSMTTSHNLLDFVCNTDWMFSGTLNDANGNPLNLTGATVTWKLDSLDGTQNFIICDNASNGGVTIVNAMAGVILVDVPAAKNNTLTGGGAFYRDWLKVTMSNGQVLDEWTGIIRAASAPA